MARGARKKLAEISDGLMPGSIRRANPDGTVGGWVPIGMAVPDSVVIEPDVMVLPGARFTEGQHIHGPGVYE